MVRPFAALRHTHGEPARRCEYPLGIHDYPASPLGLAVCGKRRLI